MFSSERRCIYQKNQLGDVICQLRFPEILTIETTLPAQFQEAIRADFPIYTVRKESPAPKLAGQPGNLQLQQQAQTNNYQFTSEDGQWRINLTSKFISLACTRYTCWEDFAGKLDKPLAAFIQIYKPAYFERVGLRYLNFISRENLCLSNVPFRELIEPQYLGILAWESVSENSVSRASVDTELSLRGGCRARIHAGPGKLTRAGKQDNEVKFIFDQDLYMPGKVPVNHSAGALQMLHAQAYGIFRGAITDTLHDAMAPVV